MPCGKSKTSKTPKATPSKKEAPKKSSLDNAKPRIDYWGAKKK